MGQHQHPRFALVASVILFGAGFVVLMFVDERKHFWPGPAAFFCWFVAFGYFLIWLIYRRHQPRLQPPGFDVVVKPPQESTDDTEASRR